MNTYLGIDQNTTYNLDALFGHYSKCASYRGHLVRVARSRRPTNGPFLATILYLKSDWLLFQRAVFANTPLVLQHMNQN